MSEHKMYKLILQIAEKTPEHLSVYAKQLADYQARDVASILKACLYLQKHCPELVAEFRDAYFEYKETK